MLKGALLVAAALLVAVAVAHPTLYPDSMIKPRGPNGELPEPHSYHVHVLYMQNNKASTQASFALRDKFMAEHPDTPHCDSLYHNNHTCYFYPDTEAAGPFVTAQWAVYFLPEAHLQIISWFMRNRGTTLDYFIHPNTAGYELEDHRDSGMSVGRTWPIDVSIFRPRPHPGNHFATHN